MGIQTTTIQTLIQKRQENEMDLIQFELTSDMKQSLRMSQKTLFSSHTSHAFFTVHFRVSCTWSQTQLIRVMEVSTNRAFLPDCTSKLP